MSSVTAAATVTALPSITGSPQPAKPVSVSILRNNQRGGTWKSLKRMIFM